MFCETRLRRCAEMSETNFVQIRCKDLKSTIVTVGGIRVKEQYLVLGLPLSLISSVEDKLKTSVLTYLK